ncbi:VPS9 domain-containing protein [Plasmodiophora brassicae]|uniref:VPS9 domain-containing protein n=1 Tax=Plasmodiophora brassicae TaxID=37360 RepID=A0A3P3YH54_PLABS|nr:unnamed protein product [Plasmodiophora brassicae]
MAAAAAAGRSWIPVSDRRVPVEHGRVVSSSAWEDRGVVLGTDRGRVLWQPVEYGLLLRGPKVIPGYGASPSPVVQVEVVGRLNAVLALKDGVVDVYSLLSMTHIGSVPVVESMGHVTDVACFVTRTNAGAVEVFAATQRQLNVSCCREGSLHFQATNRALFVPDAPLALAWISGRLCVAFAQEFMLLDVDTGSVDSLWYFTQGPPLCALFSSTHMVLSSADRAVAFTMGPPGPVVRGRVAWGVSRPPLSLFTNKLELFVAFSDHVGVFSSADISKPVGRINLKNVGCFSSVSSCVVACEGSRVIVLCENQQLERNTVADDGSLDRLLRPILSHGSDHSLNLSATSLLVDVSRRAIPTDGLQSFCRHIRLFMDALAYSVEMVFCQAFKDDILEDVIEERLFVEGGLQDLILPCFQDKFRAEDDAFGSVCGTLQDFDLNKLGSSLQVDDPRSFFSASLATMSSLTTLPSPVAMLTALSGAGQSIHTAIRDAGDSCGILDLTADEYIPILIYVLIQTRPPHMFSTYMYMSSFISQSSLRGHTGYVLTTLAIALEHMKQLSLEKQGSLLRRPSDDDVLNAVTDRVQAEHDDYPI